MKMLLHIIGKVLANKISTEHESSAAKAQRLLTEKKNSLLNKFAKVQTTRKGSKEITIVIDGKVYHGFNTCASIKTGDWVRIKDVTGNVMGVTIHTVKYSY